MPALSDTHSHHPDILPFTPRMRRGFYLTSGGIATLVIVLLVLLWGLYLYLLKWHTHGLEAFPDIGLRQQGPETVETTFEAGIDVTRLRESEELRLQGYVLTDEQGGRATIPIESAMEKLVRQRSSGAPRSATEGAR